MNFYKFLRDKRYVSNRNYIFMYGLLLLVGIAVKITYEVTSNRQNKYKTDVYIKLSDIIEIVFYTKLAAVGYILNNNYAWITTFSWTLHITIQWFHSFYNFIVIAPDMLSKSNDVGLCVLYAVLLITEMLVISDIAYFTSANANLNMMIIKERNKCGNILEWADKEKLQQAVDKIKEAVSKFERK